jgi:RNase adaptor protein for sRNA GlmZ degradation
MMINYKLQLFKQGYYLIEYLNIEYLSDQIKLLKINEISAKLALVLDLRSVFLQPKKWF